MEPASARRLRPALQAKRAQRIAHEPPGLDHLLPRHIRSRIEIEDDAVGLLDVLGARIPGVDLDHVHLDERNDGGERIGDQVLAELRLLLDADAAQRGRRPDLRMLHESAVVADRARTAHEGKRTPRDVRYDVRGDRLVVAREIELHQSYAGEDDALRMAERHAGDFRARLFAHDRSRPFVGAESLERGMADLPVPRPLRIRDLRNERRSHPVRAAAQPSRRTARERALALLERLELASQVPRDRIGVAGAHFPRENKLAFVAAMPNRPTVHPIDAE